MKKPPERTGGFGLGGVGVEEFLAVLEEFEGQVGVVFDDYVFHDHE